MENYNHYSLTKIKVSSQTISTEINNPTVFFLSDSTRVFQDDSSYNEKGIQQYHGLQIWRDVGYCAYITQRLQNIWSSAIPL